MNRILIAAAALLCCTATARADYVVRDANGQIIVIQAAPVNGKQVPNSIPTDGNGNPYSSSNPIPFTLTPILSAPYNDPSAAVGTSAGNLTFARQPTVYLSFCNEAAPGGGYIAINDTGAAALNTQPSHTLWPGGCLIYENNYVPSGVTWSAVASVASTPLRVEYK